VNLWTHRARPVGGYIQDSGSSWSGGRAPLDCESTGRDCSQNGGRDTPNCGRRYRGHALLGCGSSPLDCSQYRGRDTPNCGRRYRGHALQDCGSSRSGGRGPLDCSQYRGRGAPDFGRRYGVCSPLVCGDCGLLRDDGQLAGDGLLGVDPTLRLRGGIGKRSNALGRSIVIVQDSITVYDTL
jgi:hypothetical protein